ncbi:MAG: tRNA pseudouridine(55) synthase TruB [Patescibacteria group bacterium]|nr:tRNA pseudouridine(55) synthase TruB [Patescibacteria group bacterium]
MEGLILFNKPRGYYSREIVDYFKRLTHQKVGHGGTLDKLAQGLLIIGIGNHTKYLNYFLKKTTKVYLTEIKFGYFSETYDRENELEKFECLDINVELIKKNLDFFMGKILQKPPIYSAIKINGIPAYKLARKKIDFEIKPRYVFLYDYQILSFSQEENLLLIRIKVSSGFYVRSLVKDLSDSLKCPAVLWNLLREKINKFIFKKALSFEDFDKDFFELKIYVSGRVQGVGYRYFCQREAKKNNLYGYAKNLIDGRVRIIVQGCLSGLNDFYQKLLQGPILAKVEKIILIWQKPIKIYKNFEII